MTDDPSRLFTLSSSNSASNPSLIVLKFCWMTVSPWNDEVLEIPYRLPVSRSEVSTSATQLLLPGAVDWLLSVSTTFRLCTADPSLLISTR
jgi:hypothetical protein